MKKIVEPVQEITEFIENEEIYIEEIESHTHYKNCRIEMRFGVKKSMK